MLEVKGLSKIYKSKTKNGVDTHALDGVSLKFPEKGMVFLLGKSGSGKSTLLNVCGGLDSPSGGEVIVKGRSSKDFSQSDFDSYRNTFVGFIFQEYNILNEFTVEDNIALALELQGKPKDKKAIAELLEQVDLVGYAKRKPNTLSGGQKQRIAIARALIKSPEIIMADEPTGALDSATGKQVFDTLKKLSEDKLVIVVSHDREFAELYADRIIELKDGKVLSDVTKTQEKQQAISENVNVVDEVLCVKKGKELSDEDFEQIKKFLRKSEGDVIIAGGDKDVKNFKKVNRITEDGAKEVFKDTDEGRQKLRSYTAEESKFIGSKLPVRHAFKIGVSGLKTKPIRLFFTILLCVVSFVLFGVLSTLTFYDNEGMFKQTLVDSNHDHVVFDKIYTLTSSYYSNGKLEYSYEEISTAKFSSKDIKELEEVFGQGSFGTIRVNGMSVSLRQNNSSYWISEFGSVAYIPQTSSIRQTMKGSYPTASNEIAVSSYVAQMLCECKTTDEKGSEISFNSPNDVIGKTILINGTSYKITGVFESGEIDSKYDVLKDSSVERDMRLEYNFENELDSGLQLILAVSESAIGDFADRFDRYSFRGSDNMGGISFSGDIDNGGSNQVYYRNISSLSADKVLWINGNNSLGENDIVIGSSAVFSYISNELWNNNESEQLDQMRWELEDYTYQQNRVNEIQSRLEQIRMEWPDDYEDISEYIDLSWELENYDISYISSQIEQLEENIEKMEAQISKANEIVEKCNMLSNGRKFVSDKDGNGEEIQLSSSEIKALAEELLADETVKAILKDLSVNFAPMSREMMPLSEQKRFRVVGIALLNDDMSNYAYLSDSNVQTYNELQKQGSDYYEIQTNYKEEAGALYTRLYVPYDKSSTQTDYLWQVYNNVEFSEDGTKIGLYGSYIDTLRTVDEMVQSFSKVFLYVGLVLAVFAILLFSNFISVSISQKRREIGILRAVGARSLDVFKIFFSESFVIALICVVISTGGSVALCQILNKEIGSALGASIFVFGIASLLVIVGVAMLTAVLATFLPVWNAAKKKPVDSIRSL
ncbi:MAG: ATP-binding cassette domain-containing protein [Ruminococcaceae bacterium]|nr:ATP-binding cassette domain-containing protein [Oscillospiraceae bacterium]